ncbi:MAG: hypothetical protein R3F34_09075 [Planctomycetota bacterium]
MDERARRGTSRAGVLAVVLAIAVALVVALVLFGPERGDEPRADGTRAAEPDVSGTRGGEVELADSTLRGSGTEIEAPARTALGDVLDGRRWSDLVAPVDDASGAAIDDAIVVVIGAEGARVVRRLGDHVGARDLDDGGLAAIDSPRYVPRFFRPDELREREGATRIELAAAGAIEFRSDGERAADAEPWSYVVRAEDGDVLDPGFAIEERSVFESYADTARRLVGARDDDGWRRRQVRFVRKQEALGALLALDGPPVVAPWTRYFDPSVERFPTALDDLPLGSAYEVRSTGGSATRFEMSQDDGATWTGAPLEIEFRSPGARAIVRVRAVTGASIAGRFESSTERGTASATFRPTGRPNGRSTTVGPLPADADGSFEFHDLEPGDYHLALKWKESDGTVGLRDLWFPLAEGERKDVGEIGGADGSVLVLRPRLVVDGAPDPTLLGGAMRDARWHLTIGRRSAGDVGARLGIAIDDARDFVDMVGLEAQRVVGLEPGSYFAIVSLNALPEGVRERYLTTTTLDVREVDVGTGTTELDVDLVLESASRCRISVDVPGVDAGQQLLAYACRSDGASGRMLVFDPNEHGAAASGWSAHADEMLEPGAWSVVVLAHPDVSPQAPAWDATARYVGRVEFTVEPGVPLDVAVPLVLGASVRIDRATLGLGENEAWTRLHPTDLPEMTSYTWQGYASTSGPIVVHGLLPDTEYVVVDSDVVVTTGAGGSTTDL